MKKPTGPFGQSGVSPSQQFSSVHDGWLDGVLFWGMVLILFFIGLNATFCE